jgi:hypothetical protein
VKSYDDLYSATLAIKHFQVNSIFKREKNLPKL